MIEFCNPVALTAAHRERRISFVVSRSFEMLCLLTWSAQRRHRPKLSPLTLLEDCPDMSLQSYYWQSLELALSAKAQSMDCLQLKVSHLSVKWLDCSSLTLCTIRVCRFFRRHRGSATEIVVISSCSSCLSLLRCCRRACMQNELRMNMRGGSRLLIRILPHEKLNLIEYGRIMPRDSTKQSRTTLA